MDKKTEELIRFFETANKLKKNKRTGWVNRKIPFPESIADHSWRMALMAMVLGKELGINKDKAVKMALVHDLPEAITGDISRDHIDDYKNTIGIKPTISIEQKKTCEEKAMLEIVSSINKENGKEILSLWKEYEERKTKTALAVKEIDSLEVLLQALEYRKNHPEKTTIDDFFIYAEHKKATKSKTAKKIYKQITDDYNKIKSEINASTE